MNKNRHLVVNSYGEPNGNGTEHDDMILGEDVVSTFDVEETGLNVPKLREVTVIDGKWTIISEFIRGKTLEQLMKESPEKKEELLRRFVSLQIKTQGVVCEGLISLKEKMILNISRSDLVATTRYDLLTRLESMPKHNKLCHGDFNPSNIIITPDDKAYVRDWSHATQGNASADVARTYLLFWLNGDIDGAEKYLDLFCAKSHTAKQYIQKWMPIVAASQTVKGNEAEREFLNSWIDVVDYE